ncbi:unnamed protein product, partial [Musa acuminata var. zebrina]
MLVPSLKWYPRDGSPVGLLVHMKRSAKESEEQPKQYEQKHSEISSSPRIRTMFGNAELTGFVEVCFQVSTSQTLSAMLNRLKIVQKEPKAAGTIYRCCCCFLTVLVNLLFCVSPWLLLI